MCRERMSHSDVRRNATSEDFERYDERAALEAMEDDPLFRWCPRAGCGAGQIQERGDAEPKATCIRCFQPFCFTHRVLWHSGLTCGQFDERPELAEQMRVAEQEERIERRLESAMSQAALRNLQQEAETLRRETEERHQRVTEERLGQEFVLKNSKRCPGCRWPTQKIDGCKHMTCTLTIQTQP